MTETKIAARGEIPVEYTWNAPSLFASNEAWEAEYERVAGRVDEVRQFEGKLGDSPAVLLKAIQTQEEISRLARKLQVYALMSNSVDTADNEAAGLFSRARGLMSQLLAAAAYLHPELLALGWQTLSRFSEEEPGLAVYRHYFENILRNEAHIRPVEVEELLGLLSDPFSGPAATARVLTNADFNFRPAETSSGEKIEITESVLNKILHGSDRLARKNAWESYTDTFLSFKNTLATNLATSIKMNVFRMRARRFNSSLEASLFENNIPPAVFHNLIQTFQKHLPVWQRYWRIRRNILGVEELHPYDIWAPLAEGEGTVTYPEAVDLISAGLEPMGASYVSALRGGCLEQRWVDVLPNQGKRSGAFSAGAQGTYPFIMMSFNGDIFSLSTLAHELGHSMHSYLSWQHQPYLYSTYSLFAAEVASNFHQAMVRAHLLKTSTDPRFKLSVIEEAMSNFHRYFFIMPTLARFELETHERVERGQSLTAEGMIELMADLFSEGYGEEVQVDRPRVGITWATFSHLFQDYYVFQYATGISGAHALANRILTGQPGAVEDYLGFLKAGSSLYPLEALKRAGADLSTPQPVEETFEILSGLVDQLEELAPKTV
jgi:oligoendopeptidase F